MRAVMTVHPYCQSPVNSHLQTAVARAPIVHGHHQRKTTPTPIILASWMATTPEWQPYTTR